MSFTEISDLHDALAQRLKEYEQATGESPPLEVLNEMRYALRAAIELLALGDGATEEGSPKKIELDARILHALKCGYHDLIDGLVIVIPRILDGLTEDFPESTYTVIGEQVVRIRRDVRQAENLIARSRGKPTARRDIYDSDLYDEWFAKLLEHLRFLKDAKPDIVQMENSRRRTVRRIRWEQIVIAVIGLLTGVVLGRLWQ